MSETGSQGGRALTGPVRLLIALVAGSALVWGADTVDGSWSPGPAPVGDDEATTNGPAAVAFVQATALACPGGIDAAVGGATAPGELGADADLATAARDGAVLTVVAAGGTPPAEGATGAAAEEELPAGGSAGRVSVAGEEWALLVAGPDAAPGLIAGQLSSATVQGRRGLAYAPCRTPAEVAHLVGGGSGAGHVEQVVVTNPGSDPVRVDIEVFGAQGAVPVSGGTGLVVPARGRTAYLLDALAPGAEAPVVRILADGGPVTAHLVDEHRQGTVDLGVEVVPASAEPAQDVVLPALPTQEGTGEREVTVRLFAPEGEAVVELRALTSEGARAPAEPVVRVPAGATVDVQVPELAAGGTGLRLRSDAPVTAAARLTVAPALNEPVVLEGDASTATATASPVDETEATATPGDDPHAPRVVRPAGETAWVAATALTPAPVGAALLRPEGVPGAVTRLAVTAVDGTLAQVVWMHGTGRVVVEDVRLANDTTTVLDVPAGAVAVWVRPEPGPAPGAGIVAAVHVTGADEVGPYLTAGTVPTAPWTRPPVQVLPVLP